MPFRVSYRGSWSLVETDEVHFPHGVGNSWLPWSLSMVKKCDLGGLCAYTRDAGVSQMKQSEISKLFS